MCGIFGMILTTDPTRREVRKARRLFTELAIQSASRGRDAAGFMAVDKNGTTYLHKDNQSVLQQVHSGVWEDKLHQVGKNTRALMGHTRLATHGLNTHFNAHPFKFNNERIGSLFGMHNGVISNYTQLYPYVDGQPFDSDSANLFAFLSTYEDYEWPEAFAMIAGWYALTMYRNEKLYFVRNGAPCVFAQVPEVNAILYASTDYMLEVAAKHANVYISDLTELPSNKISVLNLYGQLKYNLKLPDDMPAKLKYWDDNAYNYLCQSLC